jgi:hypothetical protein
VKWLEIIQIRTAQNRSERLMAELTTLLSDMQEKSGGLDAILYRHADVPSDFSLHLVHQSDSKQPKSSKIGEMLSSVAREFGMVNYNIWVLEKENKKKTGETKNEN